MRSQVCLFVVIVHGSSTRIISCVSRAGPEGSLFRGVVVHINGFVSTPVATLRELLVSRGGTVEAYNTSRCTHMICESLPAAKIRELRKVRRGRESHLHIYGFRFVTVVVPL